MRSDTRPVEPVAHPLLSAAAQALATRCAPRVNELARRTACDPLERLPGGPGLPEAVPASAVAAAARGRLRLLMCHITPGLLRERAVRGVREGVPLQTFLRTESVGAYVLWRILRETARPGDGPALIELADALMRDQEGFVGTVAETYLADRTVLAAERRERRLGLLQGLLDGSPPSPGAPLDELGLDGGALVLSLYLPTGAGAPSSPGQHGPRGAQSILDRTFGTEVLALLGAAGGPAVVPGNGGAAVPVQVFEELTGRLRRVCGDEVRIAAVTVSCRQDVPAAVRTAAEVVRVARACGRPPGYHVLEDILLEYHLSRRDESSERIAALLDPITDRPELVETLRGYLERRQDRRNTARLLGLHPNTVDNRLARIGELTGLDLATPRGTALALAALLLREETEP